MGPGARATPGRETDRAAASAREAACARRGRVGGLTSSRIAPRYDDPNIAARVFNHPYFARRFASLGPKKLPELVHQEPSEGLAKAAADAADS